MKIVQNLTWKIWVVVEAVFFPSFLVAAPSPFVYPFDPVPTHLTGGRASVPPNVLLFIDTSGSMRAAATKVIGYRTVNKCLSPGIQFTLRGNDYVKWQGSTCCLDINSDKKLNFATKTDRVLLEPYSCSWNWTLRRDSSISRWNDSEGYFCQNNTFSSWVRSPSYRVGDIDYIDVDNSPELSTSENGRVQTVSCRTEQPLVETQEPILGTGSETRAQVATKVAKNVVSSNRNLRWGLATFGQGGDGPGAQIIEPVKSVDDKTSENSQNFNRLNRSVDGLRFYGLTPTTSAYYELTRYYRGMKSALPRAGLQYSSPIQYRCQKNYIIFISDGLPNWQTYSGYVTHRANTYHLSEAYNESGPFGEVSTKLPFVDSPSDGYMQGDKAYYCSDNNTCTMYNELGLSHFTRIANEEDMVKADTNLNNGLATGRDKENKSFDGTDDKKADGTIDTKFSKQTIQTYTVGFGLDVPTLKFAANEGGGQYYTAFGYDDLSKALNDILQNISIASVPFSGTTPNASTPQSGGKIDSAVATTLKVGNWSSQLRFFKLKNDGYLDTNLSVAERATYDPLNAVAIITLPGESKAYPDRVERLSDTSNLSNNDFGIVNSDNNQWKKFVNWLTRRATTDASTGYRVRTEDDVQDRYLGDVLDGTVETMGIYQKGGYQYGDSQKEYIAVGSNDGMLHIYQRFGERDHDYKDIFQFVSGTAKRDPGGRTLISQLLDTADSKYGGQSGDSLPHKFFVNAPTSWYETESGADGLSQVYLTGGLGQGGRSVYALNLDGKGYSGSSVVKESIGLSAISSNWQKTVPLWDTSTQAFGAANLQGNVEPSLGYVIGTPINGRLSLNGSSATTIGDGKRTYVLDVRYVTLFGNGINAPAQNASAGACQADSTQCIYAKPSLFVLDSLGLNAGVVETSVSDTDPVTGNPVINITQAVHNNRKSGSAAGHYLTKIEVPDSDNIDTNTPKGLTTPVAVDLDFDGIVDVAYAGDQNGNVYRFDFRSPHEKWNAEIIFKGDAQHPITVAPTAYYNPKNKKATVLFGTGSALYPEDLTDKTIQTFYGIQDNLADDSSIFGDLGVGYPLTRDDRQNGKLFKRTFTTNSDKKRYLVKDPVIFTNAHKGWYMDLQDSQSSLATGERVVTVPVLGGNPNKGATVGFTTVILSPPDGGDKVIEGCSAPSTNTEGYVMLLDAETGGQPISFRYFKDRNLDLIGIPFAGRVSSLGLISGNPYAMDAYGLSRSGKATQLGKKPNITPCQNGILRAMVGSSEEGGQLIEFYCEKDFTGVKRLSWREIF